MKSFFKIVIKAVTITAASLSSFAIADIDSEGWATTYTSLSAFDDTKSFNGDRNSYVAPIIENLGNVLNSNWYVSAEVPQSLTFEVGLPFSIIPIGDDDRSYSSSVPVGGLSDLPTIFGDHAPAVTDPFTGAQILDYSTPIVYGNETLNDLGVFTYPYLQAAGSFFHARVVLRGMILPSISNLKKFNLFGFGLQYSFGHLFQYMLPPAAQGLNVSLVYGYSTSGLGYRPDDYEGSLDLDVSAHTFDLVIGYKPFSFIEVLMTLGYQSASMESSGELICNNPEDPAHYKATHEFDPSAYTINPNISVDGNNGFKFGLAVAFQLGSSYHPVLGFDYAGKSSYTTNLLYFRQQFGKDKTPDEIAKDKGYNRNAKSNSSSAPAAAEE